MLLKLTICRNNGGIALLKLQVSDKSSVRSVLCRKLFLLLSTWTLDRQFITWRWWRSSTACKNHRILKGHFQTVFIGMIGCHHRHRQLSRRRSGFTTLVLPVRQSFPAETNRLPKCDRFGFFSCASTRGKSIWVARLSFSFTSVLSTLSLRSVVRQIFFFVWQLLQAWQSRFPSRLAL